MPLLLDDASDISEHIGLLASRCAICFDLNQNRWVGHGGNSHIGFLGAWPIRAVESAANSNLFLCEHHPNNVLNKFLHSPAACLTFDSAATAALQPLQQDVGPVESLVYSDRHF